MMSISSDCGFRVEEVLEVSLVSLSLARPHPFSLSSFLYFCLSECSVFPRTVHLRWGWSWKQWTGRIQDLSVSPLSLRSFRTDSLFTLTTGTIRMTTGKTERQKWPCPFMPLWPYWYFTNSGVDTPAGVQWDARQGVRGLPIQYGTLDISLPLL